MNTFTAVPGAIWPGAIWPGEAALPPAATQPAIVFTFGTPYFQGMSHLSTVYYLIPVNATELGVAYDPTALPVAMAFMPTVTQVPQPSDWAAGSWDANPASILYPHNAKCLIGPSGTITLGIGTYVVYVMITGDPETPVDIVGQLQVS